MALTDEERAARIAEMEAQRKIARTIQARADAFAALAARNAAGEEITLDEYNAAANVGYNPPPEQLAAEMLEKATAAVEHCRKVYYTAKAYEESDPGKYKADKLQAQAEAAYAALPDVREKLAGLTATALKDLDVAKDILAYLERGVR